MASTEGRESRQVKGGAGAPNPPELDNVQCPRCESTDTKFCYYNNYNLSQPRYLCKSCRRYWTRGGSIRNVPVGGGSRKRPRSHAPPLPPPPIPAVPYSTNTTSSYLNEGLPMSFTALLCSQQEGEYGIGLGSGFGGSSSGFYWFGENTWQMEGGGITDGGDWFG